MWITLGTPSFTSVEQVERVIGELDGPPDGMLARYIGTSPDGRVRVVSIWESKADAERFFAEKLGPALARALGPEPVGNPEVLAIDVARTYVRETVG